MPDRDLSYIDDELTANEEFVTWMGSDDSADSAAIDRRLDDDATGSFDYYAGGGVFGVDLGQSFQLWRGGREVVLDETHLFTEAAMRRMRGLLAPESNFDCPVIPGTPLDPVAAYAHRHGVDGYAAQAEVRRQTLAAMAAMSRSFDSLIEALRPLGEAFTEFGRRLGSLFQPQPRRHDWHVHYGFDLVAVESPRERALRLRRERNTGPALPGMDGRRRRG